MRFPRASGILLHPTSLPGPHGVGGLGPEAYRFADFLAASGIKIWQMLPVGPTGYGDSPYQCFSAFAGNPWLISPEKLAAKGLLTKEELAAMPDFPEDTVDFPRMIAWKLSLFEKAFERFVASPAALEPTSGQFVWLDDFACFMALKLANGMSVWTRWDPERKPSDRAIGFQKFLQHEFFEQWRELRAHCHARDIRLMGDIPIYVAHDSADVWTNRPLFELAASGEPNYVAGVPPDYFSATGQLWGNPIYSWKVMEETGFAWWIERFRAAFEMVDIVRLDHFRGFEAYWRVPGGDKTAVNGQWVKAPGDRLFAAIEEALGPLPIVAENLGVITTEVEAMRERFGFPGMSVLQFAFGNDPQGPSFRPHNFPVHRFAYTGTHDNDTTMGWWTSMGPGGSTRSSEELEMERAFCRAYLNTDGAEMHWDFIRAVMASVACTAVVPMQDVLGLGSEARMNLPGEASGHWRWRCREDAFQPSISRRLRTLAELYDR